ncbi:MAG: BatA domain-containing protein [Gemmataceae bacterium]|nr:BatA domain-containing protein [Gemmata sp.]MDW8198856.1 BatA domain-containing protein [Gemmataceae bacterium]
MTFLAPLMMLGAAAVSIPIALHFFYRARYRPLPWAPMKFLREAIEQTSRRLKFQEWLLLALRCLAILLLALAIARPAERSVSAAGAGEPIDAVFVFDTSYSMAAPDGDKTRLERAQEAALAILDTLPNRSTIQIISCADRAMVLGPVSPDNRDQARQLIHNLDVTSLATDFLPGLTEALRTSEHGSAAAKEIYLFSDLQKSGLERQHHALRGLVEQIREHQKVNLIFIRCGHPERKVANVAVVDIALHATIPHTNTRVPFDVTLKNTGQEPLRGVKVALEIDGQAVERDAAQVDFIDAGETVKVTLTGSLTQAGLRLVSARVEGDGIAGDNILYRVIAVREKVRILLVAHPYAGQPYTDAGDWLVRWAFFPFDAQRDKEKIDRYFIEVESVAPKDATPEKLTKTDVVYLLNTATRTTDPLEGISPAFIRQLKEFVTRGGGLVIGCGDAVNIDGYNRSLGADGAGLLPLPIRGLRQTTEATPFTPAIDSVVVPSVLAPAEEGQRQAFHNWLRRVTLTKMVELDETGPGSRGGQVLLRTTDGLPLVAARVVGNGEVIFFATSLDETWGRLMSEGALAAPLNMYLLAHLTSRQVPGGTRLAGEVLTWYPPQPEPNFELILPRPRREKAGSAERPRLQLGPGQWDGERLVVRSADALVAGEYAIVPGGAAAPTGLMSETGVVFAVNPDLRETDNLSLASDSELEQLLGWRPAIIPAGAGTESAVRERRTQGEWTEYVLLFLLMLLVAEAAWAWFCGRAW